MMPHKNFVLFDFDGVISDSYDVAYSVSRKICHRITDEYYKRAFEGNVNDWDWNDIPGSHAECRHDTEWFGEYVPAFEEQAKPFEGISDVIKKLSDEYVLIVVSSTITSPIQGFLEKHHLGRYFSEIMGNDVHTHKTEKIRMVFETYATSSSECLFVTDSLGDMRESEEMGVGAVGVTWGWHSRETLEKGHPFRIVETPSEIPIAVADYFAGKSGI